MCNQQLNVCNKQRCVTGFMDEIQPFDKIGVACKIYSNLLKFGKCGVLLMSRNTRFAFLPASGLS